MDIERDGKKMCFPDREHEPISFKLKLIQERFAMDINRQLKEDDITFSQLIVLSYLKAHTQEKVTQKELSEALHIKHPTTIGLLKRLEEKEMVQVIIDPDNRKFRNIILTKKGNDLMESSNKHRDFIDRSLTNGMSAKEISELRRLLDKLYDNMNEIV